MLKRKSISKKPPAKPAAPVAKKPPRNLPSHEVVSSSQILGAVGVESWGRKLTGDIDMSELVKALDEQTIKVLDGDMRPVEAMLYRQAKTLEVMFTHLTRQASLQTQLTQFQVNLTLALKVQAQCRSTLEALAEIKNPRPVAFVKQANISNGPQQVNNGAAASRMEKIESEPSKLLEAEHGNHLDTRAPSQAGRADSHLATVGKVHRAKVA